jgi:iron complex transport system permease protein
VTTRLPWPALTALLAVVIVGLGALAIFLGAAATTPEIVMSIRGPRIALALAVGSGLAVAGVLMQGVFQNPLADPAIIGVSTSAALGTTIAIALGLGFHTLGAAFAACVGAGIAIVVVVRAARDAGRTQTVTLLLAGIAVAAFAGALLTVLVSANDAVAMRSLTFWLTGSLALATWASFWTVVGFLFLGLVLARMVSAPIDLLSLGDRAAAASGVPVERVRGMTMAAVVLLVAPGVAVVGVIAFVGLMIPHAMRMLIGPRNGPLIVTSALAGAALILAADTIARNAVSPVEIPIGAITAAIGAPVFFFLLRNTRRMQGGWG